MSKKSAGPQRIGEILRDVLASDGLASKLKHFEVYAAWEQIADGAMRAHTCIAGFAHHKLYVDVDSAAQLHELRTFHKLRILGELRGRLPGRVIQDIVFRPAGVKRS